MIRKWLAIGFILLFVGTSIIPAIAQNTEKQSSRGNWLYVGGSGPGNYSKIQDAIDNASDGDTVFVYSGWYNESISIDKPISVYGQGRETTFIGKGQDIYTSVRISGDGVQFKGFAIKGDGVVHGIYISDCTNSQISENYVEECSYGIVVVDSNLIVVLKNTIQKCYPYNVDIGCSDNIVIKENVIYGDGEQTFGIWIDCGYFLHNKKISVQRNSISNNQVGLVVRFSLFTIVQENNFLNNKYGDAGFLNSFFTSWKRNYWNQALHGPKVIKGGLGAGTIGLPWLNFDWYPAQEPYDIPEMR